MRLETKITAGIVSLVVVILLLAFMPFIIVQSGTVGVLKTWGKVQPVVLEPGIHAINPFSDSVVDVSIKPVQSDYNIEVGPSGAFTKENQTVGADVTVFFHFDKDTAAKMVANYGADKISSMIGSATRESFKDVIGTYSVFDISASQPSIRGQVLEKLKSKIADLPVQLSDFRINNYAWSQAFDAQIQATMQAAQQVKKAEQDLKLTEQQAQKQVKEAEATRQALILTAEGEKAAASLRADAKALEGEGIAKYNAAVAKNMDMEIKLKQLEIERIRAEKWNGVQPQNNYFVPPVFGTK